MRSHLSIATALLAATLATHAGKCAHPPRTVPVGTNPESVVIGPDGRYYVTLMGQHRGKASRDGKIVAVEGTQVSLFCDGLADPKGLTKVGDLLVTTDIDRVWAIDPQGGKHLLAGPEAFPTPPRFLNDIAFNLAGDGVIVSDMGARDYMMEAPGKLWPLESEEARRLPDLGRIYGITMSGKVTLEADPLPAMPTPNGLALGPAGDLYAVDTFFGSVWLWSAMQWKQLATGLRSADGIAVSDTGCIYVSEAFTGKIWRMRAPNAQPELLTQLRSAADLLLDASNRQLVIPDLQSGTIVFLPLPE